MEYEDAESLMSNLELRLGDIAGNLVELTNAIKAADRGRNDALSVVGSINASMQAQDVEIQRLLERVELNDQAVQSCIGTLGELSKLVQTIAAKQPPEPASGFEPFVAKAGKITPFEKPL